MNAIMDSLWKATTALALFPIVPFVIVLFGYGAYVRDRKKALRMAMDVSTIFLILCVSGQYSLMFDSTFGFYGILLIMILAAGLLGNAQFRKRGSVDVKRIFRAIWRLSFFAMSFLYVIFMIVLLGKVIFSVA
ncbi:hypothetical protein PAT3040_00648 [Paenibacillus agaridevorans]|uniref:DUF3397 domain-containing protein n=1 Tax=Paenibacillus agaridevorans TaxID=171404 RepID=A0A2R5EHT7_9BACL|nr:DUF3397 domain-containing protein [Paenibacillus agaridevorans]GBG06142.1 hypothetical protein PAT3040_00648 [Paenibacillus agaridevorans]